LEYKQAKGKKVKSTLAFLSPWQNGAIHDGFIVEMPYSQHKIGNVLQHPFGNTPGMGIGDLEREVFDDWREAYWKARAREELLRRWLVP
jgi:hypothetical protein